MPVAQGTNASTRQAVLVALGGLAGLVAVIFLVVQAGQLGGGGTEIPVQLGEPVFTVGNVDELSRLVAENEPLLLPDASGGDRDIIVNHVADEPDEGWVAFAARSLTAPRDCFVQWQADEDMFVDSCDGTQYPPDGSGLQQFGTSIDGDGTLRINLNVTSS